MDVKPHAAWGVSIRNSSSRPGVDPFILTLTAATVACNEMLHDGAGRGRAGGLNGLPPRVPPSQVRGARSSCSGIYLGGICSPGYYLWQIRCRVLPWVSRVSCEPGLVLSVRAFVGVCALNVTRACLHQQQHRRIKSMGVRADVRSPFVLCRRGKQSTSDNPPTHPPSCPPVHRHEHVVPVLGPSAFSCPPAAVENPRAPV